MLNIITNQVYAKERRGPYKVFANLVKGLDLLNYPYVINRSFVTTERIWIQDNLDAYRSLPYKKNYRAVVGPNLVSTPDQLPFHPGKSVQFVVPSDWLRSRWLDFNYESLNVVRWPIGIDLKDYHPDLLSYQRDSVLIYFKKRDLHGLSEICNHVARSGVKFKVCIYGSYTEDEYKKMLSDVRFVIWYGCHETQGIGLLETLAMNVPVLVVDDHRGDSRTAAPYFSDICGIKIDAIGVFENAFQTMIDTWSQYKPWSYVKEHFDIKTQAKEFIDLWETWGLSYYKGLNDKAVSNKIWQVPLALRIKKFLGNK